MADDGPDIIGVFATVINEGLAGQKLLIDEKADSDFLTLVDKRLSDGLDSLAMELGHLRDVLNRLEELQTLAATEALRKDLAADLVTWRERLLAIEDRLRTLTDETQRVMNDFVAAEWTGPQGERGADGPPGPSGQAGLPGSRGRKDRTARQARKER